MDILYICTEHTTNLTGHLFQTQKQKNSQITKTKTYKL